jgi:hypothetical protein
MLTTNFSRTGTTRGQQSGRQGGRSDRLALTVSRKFRSSPILSFKPLFHGKHDSKSGKTIPDVYNEGLMADRDHPNRIY